ncbi:MAG TPA: 30S ribosomal protein S19e [Candidatus Nanoarchaeia archaeon]|nr:30S ribosomal protein S19e [Candidatus Nanoarchaeia archaeon]
MASVYDNDPTELLQKAAQELKKNKGTQIPNWAKVVKTGVGQERPPENPDWWYIRVASVLRKIYLRGPIGVSKLRTFYGRKKNRGVRPEEFRKGSGKIIRVILQQLETAGLVKQAQKGAHKGRVVTPKGQSFLDTIIRRHGSRRNQKTEAPVASAGNAAATIPGAASAPAAD